ncbi:MAG: helicase-related protein, partial [Firmicutes bacterium]|nr:helicase-related protein [Bacillota bacterium]
MRDMSVINTPPKERLPVQTFVTEHHPRLLKNAIERELARQGQVYYIFNSVRNIEEKKAKLQQLVPQAKILMAHGQMTETQLNPVMTDFLAGDGDILLCTTIAEAGLDIPNVNTLIVENAENFGLAQLYQLRGRVGRSKRQAFAYFTYRPDKTLADDARKRLAAIRDFTQLGAGFKIAMRDLEIRGAGNLLGPEQHGHIAAVGFDLYCKLVNEAIEQGLGETPDTNMNIELKLDLGISAFIPESYIPETNLKFEIYNRISGCRSQAESVLLQNELQDRFGQPPQPVYNLFKILQIRNLAQALRINALLAPRNMLTLNFGEHNPFNGPAMLQISQEFGRKLKFSGQKQLLIKLQLQNQDDEPRLKEISAFLNKLLALINKK